MTEEFVCPVELKPMEKWVQEGEPEECRPCMLAPIIQWYRDELKERGQLERAQNLENVAENTNVDDMESVLTLCQEFDKIKQQVEGPLRERLKEFDCQAQIFNPEEAIEE